MKIQHMAFWALWIALPTALTLLAQDKAAAPEEKGLTSLRLTVLYDNVPFDENLQIEWGFACLVQGAEKTILFDTGTEGAILLSNMKKAGFSPDTVDAIVLSHPHQDHTGGLATLLDRRPGLPVYFLSSFPEGIQRFAAKGRPVLVDKPVQICPWMHSSGTVDGAVREEALVVETRKGLVIVTGCAHPGIVEMVQQIKSVFHQTILLVMGGFHLIDKSPDALATTARNLRSLGVVCMGASHCSGSEAMKVFKNVWKERYIPVGAGKTIDLDDLPRP